ncbi:MAG TPA: signal peptidase I [Bdellovibrionota bacterium]|nr:signal peptidase I [Bdellovibrionota bacterium]
MADISDQNELQNNNDRPGGPNSEAGNQGNKSRKKWIIENLTSLVLALFIVFMIRSSVVEAFKIPSGSMIPTLLIGDHIFVNKFAYGFKIPFSDLVTDHPIYVVKRDPPKRGDVIVFMYPKDESFYYIKRVVGIPGDTVEIRNKVLYINQQMVARDVVTGPAADKVFKSLDDPKYSSTNLDLFTERLDKADHMILLDKNSFMGESHGPITVPPDNLFVMGDNRDFSNDSRFWGFVPMRNVKGKAMVIWLSLWVNFSDSQFVFRPERIGTVLR